MWKMVVYKSQQSLCAQRSEKPTSGFQEIWPLQELQETTTDELTARSTRTGDLQNAWTLPTRPLSALT